SEAAGRARGAFRRRRDRRDQARRRRAPAVPCQASEVHVTEWKRWVGRAAGGWGPCPIRGPYPCLSASDLWARTRRERRATSPTVLLRESPPPVNVNSPSFRPFGPRGTAAARHSL